MTVMAKVVALKSEAPDAFAAKRAELMAEAARLNKVAQARAVIERRLAELDADQAALDEAEREAWRVWAQNDAEGPPPSPRMQEREGIARRRALLAGDLTGALNGQKAVAPRLAALNAELHDLMLKVFARRVDALIAEAEEVNRSVHAAAKAYLSVCEQADGLRDAVIEALDPGGQRRRPRARGDLAGHVLSHRAARGPEARRRRW